MGIGFAHDAAVVSTDSTSPLRLVALADGTTTSLSQGDRIFSLDGIPVNPDLTNMELHKGVTTMQFARSGSDVVLTGTMVIQS